MDLAQFFFLNVKTVLEMSGIREIYLREGRFFFFFFSNFFKAAEERAKVV